MANRIVESLESAACVAGDEADLWRARSRIARADGDVDLGLRHASKAAECQGARAFIERLLSEFQPN